MRLADDEASLAAALESRPRQFRAGSVEQARIPQVEHAEYWTTSFGWASLSVLAAFFLMWAVGFNLSLAHLFALWLPLPILTGLGWAMAHRTRRMMLLLLHEGIACLGSVKRISLSRTKRGRVQAVFLTIGYMTDRKKFLEIEEVWPVPPNATVPPLASAEGAAVAVLYDRKAPSRATAFSLSFLGLQRTDLVRSGSRGSRKKAGRPSEEGCIGPGSSPARREVAPPVWKALSYHHWPINDLIPGFGGALGIFIVYLVMTVPLIQILKVPQEEIHTERSMELSEDISRRKGPLGVTMSPPIRRKTARQEPDAEWKPDPSVSFAPDPVEKPREVKTISWPAPIPEDCPSDASHCLGSSRWRAGRPRLLEFTADSKHLLVSNGESVRAWSVSTGDEVWTRQMITTNGGSSPPIMLSRDGSRLLMVEPMGGDFYLRVLDLTTLPQTPAEISRERCYEWMAFDPEATRVLVRDWRSGIGSVREIGTGKILGSFPCSGGAQYVFSPGGRWLLQLEGKTMRLIETATGKLLVQKESDEELRSPRMHPDGTRVLFSRGLTELATYDLQTLNLIKARAHDYGHGDFSLDPSGAFVLAGRNDGFLWIWNLANDSIEEKALSELGIGGGVRKIEAVRIAPDGRQAALVTETGYIWLLDLERWKARASSPGHQAPIRRLWFEPGGRFLISLGADNALHRWDLEEGGAKSVSIYQTTHGIQDVALSPAGELLAIRVNGHEVLVLNKITRKIISRFEVYSSVHRSTMQAPKEPSTMRWSEDGETLFVLAPLKFQLTNVSVSVEGSEAGAWIEFEARTGHERRRIETHHPRSLRFPNTVSRDGNILASGYENRELNLWFVDKKEELKISRPYSDIRHLELTPDGGRIAACFDEGHVQVWDARSGQELLKLDLSRDWLRRIAFSHDNHYLVAGGDDGVVRLIDLRAGKTVQEWPYPDSGVNALAFDHSGQQVAAGGFDSRIVVWQMP